MRTYEERKAARIERLRARAARASEASDAAHAGVRRIADNIPFGQPILVGHHSERHARRDAERIDRGMRKAVDLSKEAQDLERRADAAERNAAISSDDSDAVEKLREKLAGVNAERARAKRVNEVIRKARRGEDEGWREQAVEALVQELKLSGGTAERFLEPDCFGNFGVPAYHTSGLGSEARRIEKRIALLEANAARPARAPELVGDVRIEESENRVRLYFPGKPSEEKRRALKSEGFRWSPSEGAWQRMASDWAWARARHLAGS